MSGFWRHAVLASRIAQARLLNRRVPFFVQLAPTSRCNLNCTYCYAQFHERNGINFPFPELLKVIDGLARLGTRFMMIAGGEPMMYPDIAPLVQRVSDNGIECLLNTNGFQVEKRIDELFPVDIFSISLDGPKEIHDHYRGEGSYDVALTAIKAARARKKKVQLQYTMTCDLKVAFNHVRQIAKNHGCVIAMNFLRPQNQPGGEIIKPEEATDAEIKEFLDWLIREKPRELPYPRFLLRYERKWPYSFGRHIIERKSELRGFKPMPCAAGRFLIAIDNKGDIYPCTKFFYTRFYGNCADGNIERAWRVMKPVECQACLDPGANYLNQLLLINPRAIFGFWRAFF